MIGIPVPIVAPGQTPYVAPSTVLVAPYQQQRQPAPRAPQAFPMDLSVSPVTTSAAIYPNTAWDIQPRPATARAPQVFDVSAYRLATSTVYPSQYAADAVLPIAPLRRRPQDASRNPYFRIPDLVQPDKWWTPFVEPVRRTKYAGWYPLGDFNPNPIPSHYPPASVYRFTVVKTGKFTAAATVQRGSVIFKVKR